MKLQFEIDDRFAKELKDTCMLFNGIDLDNTGECRQCGEDDGGACEE